MNRIKIMQFTIKNNTNDIETYIIPELRDSFQKRSVEVDKMFSIIRKYNTFKRPIKIKVYIKINERDAHVQTKSNFRLHVDEDSKFTEHCNETLNVIFTHILQEGMNNVQ